MKRMVVTGAALIAAFALAGCGGGGAGGGGDNPGAEAPAPMVAGTAMEGAPAVDKAAQPIAGPQVITTAWLTMRVTSVSDGVTAVTDLVKAQNGSIQQQDLSTADGTATATIVVRVPAGQLDAFLTQVGALGTVENVSRQAADVTQQAVDLDARIAALTASVTRLKELLDQASNVADLVAVETELANRQAELDGLIAQRDYLADQVAMSTVTVTLMPTVQVGAWQAPGFLAGVQNGIAALVALAGAAITTLGFLAPFLVILALIAVPIAWVLVRRARRKG